MISLELLKQYNSSYKTVSAGEFIFSEGAECTHYHQLMHGRIRWVNIHEDGREFIHHIILSGESFGELPLFDHLPYAASAVADSDCTLIRLTKEAFIQCLSDHPEMHFAFSRLFVKRLRFNFLLLQEMAQFEPEHQISRLLEYFKDNSSNVCQVCNVVKLTRQEIANMTGLRVETVIRTLKNMAQANKVTIIKGKVFMPGKDTGKVSGCSGRFELTKTVEKFQTENKSMEISGV